MLCLIVWCWGLIVILAKKYQVLKTWYRSEILSIVMVDVESDGPIPGDYSMISIGAVIVDDTLEQNFYGKLKPVSDNWIPAALEVSGFSREETLGFNDPNR